MSQLKLGYSRGTRWAKQPTRGLTFKASHPREICSKPINCELGGKLESIQTHHLT